MAENEPQPSPAPVPPDLPPRPGYRVKRLEKRVVIARQSWPEFFRDLAIRTAAIAVAVAVIAGLVWLLAHR
jgi:hypothetical protein